MKIVILLIIIAASSIQVHSGELKLQRSDVDQSRSHFVTSTYIFGIDVITEDVLKCNGVTFELHFNQTQYIKLSEWRVLGFGNDANAVVIPDINESSGTGTLYIGVLSGDILNKAVFDNPKVIHLEFAVIQSAPNNEVLTFSFSNAKAVILEDTIGKIVDLTSEAVNYNIHSFVNVWPGDADNNGIVNTDDVAMIGYLLGLGSDTKSMRSFKRPSGSTLWSPQRVLTWDSAAATYADCDGNADITIRDALVVSLNFGKTHSFTEESRQNPNQINSNLDMTYDESYPNNSSISLKLLSQNKYKAIAATVQLPVAFDLKGIKPKQQYSNDYFFYYNTVNNNVNLIYGSKKSDLDSYPDFEFDFIGSENTNYQKELITIYAEGITSTGYIEPILTNTSSASETVSKSIESAFINTISYKSNSIHPSKLNIYALNGIQISEHHFDGEIALNCTSLPHGLYFIKIVEDNKIKFFKLFVSK